jgi:hypothetical protein
MTGLLGLAIVNSIVTSENVDGTVEWRRCWNRDQGGVLRQDCLVWCWCEVRPLYQSTSIIQIKFQISLSYWPPVRWNLCCSEAHGMMMDMNVAWCISESYTSPSPNSWTHHFCRKCNKLCSNIWPQRPQPWEGVINFVKCLYNVSLEIRSVSARTRFKSFRIFAGYTLHNRYESCLFTQGIA